MNLLPRLQDVLGILFLATFMFNFGHWIRRSQAGDLLFVPQSLVARSCVYFFGLFGPILFFSGKLMAQQEFGMVGLSMTNGCLIYMNVAAIVARWRRS